MHIHHFNEWVEIKELAWGNVPAMRRECACGEFELTWKIEKGKPS